MQDIFVKGEIIEASGKEAIVRFRCQSGCSSCLSRSSCDKAGKENTLTVNNRLKAKEGDKVEVKIPALSYYSSLLLVFGLPPAMLIIGYLITYFWTQHNVVSLLVGLVCFLLSFVLIKYYEGFLMGKKESRPSIVKVF